MQQSHSISYSHSTYFALFPLPTLLWIENKVLLLLLLLPPFKANTEPQSCPLLYNACYQFPYIGLLPNLSIPKFYLSSHSIRLLIPARPMSTVCLYECPLSILGTTEAQRRHNFSGHSLFYIWMSPRGQAWTSWCLCFRRIWLYVNIYGVVRSS